jgi:hypothetical protein
MNEIDLDLGTVSALINVLAAFGSIWTMQYTTMEAGVKTPVQWVKTCHRAAYGLLAIGLFANAMYTIDTDTDPRWIDIMVFGLLLSVMIISVVRHKMGRPLVAVIEETRDDTGQPQVKIVSVQEATPGIVMRDLSAGATMPAKALTNGH